MYLSSICWDYLAKDVIITLPRRSLARVYFKAYCIHLAITISWPFGACDCCRNLCWSCCEGWGWREACCQVCHGTETQIGWHGKYQIALPVTSYTVTNSFPVFWSVSPTELCNLCNLHNLHLVASPFCLLASILSTSVYTSYWGLEMRSASKHSCLVF